MTDREIERKLKDAMRAAAPNDLDEILSRCTEQTRSVISMKKNSKSKRILLGVAAAAACMVLAFGLGGYYKLNNEVMAAVSLDVNPSVQLELNRRERVMSVTPLNEDGWTILDGMDLENTTADVAINALIGSMVKNGYVTEDANSVLLSVQGSNAVDAADLRQKLGVYASEALNSDLMQCAVITQVVEQSKQLAELAQQYGISAGKAQFVEQIVQQNQQLRFEDLANKPVNDLSLLASGKKTDKAAPAVTAHVAGETSDSGYIGREKAIEAALKAAGVSAQDAILKSVEFDMENGVMTYEVEFYAGKTKYEVDVNASTGEVVKQEKEATTADLTGLISAEQAQNLALAKAGVTAETAQGLHSELDDENGVMVYEVTFIAGGYRYEYELNAHTGEMLDEEKEPVNTGDGTYVGEGQAVKAALAHAKVKQGNVVPGSLKAELDEEDGKVVYEVEFIVGTTEYEYRIDAKTGSVIKAEQEPVDHDDDDDADDKDDDHDLDDDDDDDDDD